MRGVPITLGAAVLALLLVAAAWAQTVAGPLQTTTNIWTAGNISQFHSDTWKADELSYSINVGAGLADSVVQNFLPGNGFTSWRDTRYQAYCTVRQNTTALAVKVHHAEVAAATSISLILQDDAGGAQSGVIGCLFLHR